MKQKILLIEDDDPFRENMTELLELNNYEVYTAVNGIEGIQLALSKLPDLILCDIMMPGMDGFNFLQFIRSTPVLNRTCFIFISAFAQRNEIRRGLDLGADDYIVKPFTEIELLCCLKKYKQEPGIEYGSHKKVSD